MVEVLKRREALSLFAAAAVLPGTAFATDFIDLEWDDLLPKGQRAIPRALQSLIEHDSPSLSSQQPASTGVRTDWNGQIVRLPGFVVPIDTVGTADGVYPCALCRRLHSRPATTCKPIGLCDDRKALRSRRPICRG